jgi:putative spermidine/putrescine transport system substrate-binding protein
MTRSSGAVLSRRTFLRGSASLTAAGVVASALPRTAAGQDNLVVVNTWGGSWTAAEEAAYFKPFTEKTGIQVKTVAPVSFAKLKAQVQTKNYEWDVSVINAMELRQGELEGLLEPIDWGLVNRANLWPNAVYTQGIGAVALATALTYRKDKFPGGGPKSWADFWDVKRFPGPRSLYNRPYTAMAFALLADGVPMDKLFPMDMDRAFKKLNEIKPHVKVWWTQASQSQQLIRDGEVVMLPMWNARATELADQGVPVELVWNQAESYATYWLVAKGSPRAKNAWRFIDSAVQSRPQAEFCKRMAYGPLNPKAFELIPAEQARRMPTYPEHAKVGFVPDPGWLAPNLPTVRERFSQWLAS